MTKSVGKASEAVPNFFGKEVIVHNMISNLHIFRNKKVFDASK